MATPRSRGRRLLPEVVADAARRWPSNVAIVDGDARVTYSELDDRISAAAFHLAQLGVRPGQHVATFLGESWRHVVVLYAIMRVGAIAVPLNLTWEADEVRGALEDADIDVFIVGDTYRGASLRDKLIPLQIHDASSRRDLGLVTVVFDGAPVPGTAALDELFVPAPPSATRSEWDSNPIAYLMFTSGSTARPKAAAITHEAAIGCAVLAAERMGIGSDDRMLNISPFYHCGGLVLNLLVAQVSGALIHVFEGYQHDAMVAAMWADASSVLVGFDVVTMRLVEAALTERGYVPFRKIMTGPGIGVYDRLVSLGADVFIVYALTEASNLVSLPELSDTHALRRDANGKPPPGVEVSIVDPETGRVCGPLESGEIRFKGWNLMRGYYQRGGGLMLPLDSEGFFRTGDYGYMDADGHVYYRGRYAAMIKTGGENVSQAEVENFLVAELDAVRQAAVVGIPDERWGEAVVAFVEFVPGASLTTEELRAACRGRIAGYKMPQHVMAVEPGEWPMTPTGKVIKLELVDRATRAVAAAETHEH